MSDMIRLDPSKVKLVRVEIEEQLRQAAEEWENAGRQFDRTRLVKAKEYGLLLLRYKAYFKGRARQGGQFGLACEALGLKRSERALWTRIAKGWDTLEKKAAEQGRKVEEVGIKEADKLLRKPKPKPDREPEQRPQPRMSIAATPHTTKEPHTVTVPEQESAEVGIQQGDAQPQEENQPERKPSVKEVLNSLRNLGESHLEPTDTHWVLDLEIEGLLPIPDMTAEEFEANLDGENLWFEVRIGLNNKEKELCRLERAKVTSVRWIGVKGRD